MTGSVTDRSRPAASNVFVVYWVVTTGRRRRHRKAELQAEDRAARRKFSLWPAEQKDKLLDRFRLKDDAAEGEPGADADDAKSKN